MEWIGSILRECKVLGMVGAIVVVVWACGHQSHMEQQAHWLERIPPVNPDHDLHAALETADLDSGWEAD